MNQAQEQEATLLPMAEEQDLQRLSSLLAQVAQKDGCFGLLHGVHIVRASQPEAERTYINSLPSICIVPQGSKSVAFGETWFEYDRSQMVVYAAEIPINVKITTASAEVPYYCFVLPIPLERLHSLIAQVFGSHVPTVEKTKAVYVRERHPKIIKSAIRLMDVVQNEEDADLLVPLILDEIIIRLLRSPVGPELAQIGVADSHAGKISKVISWLKENYKTAIKMESLAQIAGMSLSSFHIHFKEITSMSPLQFQKSLRLQEARLLVRAGSFDINTIAFEVGYSSPTQFSREYNRYFGVAPSKDGMR